ncbi:MAG: hypothetical protein AAF628_06185 [Planctomycetota bacterium]
MAKNAFRCLSASLIATLGIPAQQPESPLQLFPTAQAVLGHDAKFRFTGAAPHSTTILIPSLQRNATPIDAAGEDLMLGVGVDLPMFWQSSTGTTGEFSLSLPELPFLNGVNLYAQAVTFAGAADRIEQISAPTFATMRSPEFTAAGSVAVAAPASPPTAPARRFRAPPVGPRRVDARAPFVGALSVSSGRSQEMITINGRNFGNDPDRLCVIGMNGAFSFDVIAARGNQIDAVLLGVPPGAAPSPIMVAVGNKGEVYQPSQLPGALIGKVRTFGADRAVAGVSSQIFTPIPEVTSAPRPMALAPCLPCNETTSITFGGGFGPGVIQVLPPEVCIGTKLQIWMHAAWVNAAGVPQACDLTVYEYLICDADPAVWMPAFVAHFNAAMNSLGYTLQGQADTFSSPAKFLFQVSGFSFTFFGISLQAKFDIDNLIPYLAGDCDTFAAPVEPASPLGSFASWMGGGRDFDEADTGLDFGHTSTGWGTLPVDAGTLQITLRADSTGDSTDDTIRLSFDGSSSFAWSRSIKDLSTSSTWNAGQTETFCLNLAELPTGSSSTVDLLSALATGSLDVYVEGDTAVDCLTVNIYRKPTSL